MVGGHSIVFTLETVVDETFIRTSGNIWKSIVGIDASQIYPHSICQPMTKGLSTRWEKDTEVVRVLVDQMRGGGGPSCIKIGYSEPTLAESREGSSRRRELSGVM